MSEWTVDQPWKLSVPEPVDTVCVRVVGGTVNVVGTDTVVAAAPPGESGGEGRRRVAEVQISEIEGPPLLVRHEGSTLTVTYEDLSWKGLMKWLERRERHRRAVVSLVVPAGTRVEVGVVGASATVSGVEGPALVRSVTGDVTLTGTGGRIEAETVSGGIEVQSASGPLRFTSVSGGLTLVDGAGPSVRADSVSGDMILDLDPGDAPTDIRLTSVSGEIAIRLPHPADAVVEADTTSGTVSNAFEDLRVSGQWGSKRITGRLGPGTGRLRATTVSGSLALLRRPARDTPRRSARDEHGPQDTQDSQDPQDTQDTPQKKVL